MTFTVSRWRWYRVKKLLGLRLFSAWAKSSSTSSTVYVVVRLNCFFFYSFNVVFLLAADTADDLATDVNNADTHFDVAGDFTNEVRLVLSRASVY